VSQRDTGVTQDNAAELDGTVTFAAYKHYLTNFKRDVSNLKINNGARRTVCLRINDAMRGMLYHIGATNDEAKSHLNKYLDSFATEVHYPLLKDYPHDNVMATPLGLYKDNMDALYQLVHTYKLAY
jgi:hypothetical protein